MAPKKILAVAIGNQGFSHTFSTADVSQLNLVRPYIRGLIHKLSALGMKIGTDYVVDYREFEDSQISFSPADVVLCMSTTVARAAKAASSGIPSTTPVVAIVSDPSAESFPNNFFGISGQRSQKGRAYYDRFLDTVPSLNAISQTVYVLHKNNYSPSVTSLHGVQGGGHTAQVQPVSVSSINSVVSSINALQQQSGGLLILPADWFFAKANDIIIAARGKMLPDFWPVTDWVKQDGTGAVGGYGVSQLMCGELLGARIEQYWRTSNFPNPAFPPVANSDTVWMASVSAATGRNVLLGNASGLIHV